MQAIWLKIKAASDILLDPDRRAKYDRALVEALPKHSDVRRDIVKKLLQSAAEPLPQQEEMENKSPTLQPNSLARTQSDASPQASPNNTPAVVETNVPVPLDKDFTEHNQKIQKLKERGRTNADRKARAQKKLFNKRLDFKTKRKNPRSTRNGPCLNSS